MAMGLTITALAGLPLFEQGMDLAGAIAAAAGAAGEAIGDHDVVVIAQKVVSKVEGRTIQLAEITPNGDAHSLARETGRPAELAQLILDESSEILRATSAAIIVRHRSGHVLANAGIDSSNVQGGDQDTVLLWPVEADASARAIRAGLADALGTRPAVVIADSLGRAWRIGTVGTAIGCAGLTVLDDRRGEPDLFGRTLQATIVAVADAIAAAAVLAMGEGREGTPVALVRGAGRWVTAEDGQGAVGGLRPIAEDMFR
ncbi:MAG: coenzyme F420-0:L-glutamate ligase [Novosphingobium sp.]|nr:coenzyme F420-0:L-glutamate ligase [Novosphingobium sp.]